MPTYEYECTKCGTTTEVFHSITDKPRRKLKKSDNPQCDCNAPVVRKVGTGAGIIFKGSGFYETDYRSENYKKSAKAEKEAASEKSSKKDDSSKTEKKSGNEPTKKKTNDK